MFIEPTFLSGVEIHTPAVYKDERGFFFESFNQKIFNELIGREVTFVQDNHSRSSKNVLRGLHYQIEQAQGKLVRVTQGAVFDVAVDLRQASKTFGKWVGEILSAENKKQLWIPAGFAHGFLVLSESAEIIYKTTDYYAPVSEKIIAWADTFLAITWPLDSSEPILSSKDKLGVAFEHAEYF